VLGREAVLHRHHDGGHAVGQLAHWHVVGVDRAAGVELGHERQPGVGIVAVDNAFHYLWGGGYVIEAAKKEAGPRVVNPDGSMAPGAAPWATLAAKRLGRQITPRTLERFDQAKISEAPDTMRKIETGEIKRIDNAVQEAAAERTVRTGKLVTVPPVVPRTPWDRLGCARGDVAAAVVDAVRAVQAGHLGAQPGGDRAGRGAGWA
jgi:hypothetical protein